MLFQETSLGKLHGKVQSGLASKGRKDAVGFLFFDELLYYFHSQRLDVNFVSDIFIRHDGSRIGV